MARRLLTLITAFGLAAGLVTTTASVALAASCGSHCYVSTTGSDTAAGTSGAPLLTISAAVNAVSPGGTITVAAGTYEEYVAINKPIVLEGANSTRPCASESRNAESFIAGNAAGIGAVSILADDVTVSGFKITQVVDSPGGTHSGVWVGPGIDGYTVKNNLITGNIIGMVANTAGPSIVRCNIIAANNRAGALGGVGIYSEKSDRLTIQDNVIRGHTINGPIVLGAKTPYTDQHKGLVVDGNTFDNELGIFAIGITGGIFSGNDIETNDATALSLHGADDDITITKNLFHGNARAIRVQNDVGLIKNVHITRNSFVGNSDYGVGNVSGYSGSIDAECNWWNSPAGAVGPADDTTGAVDASPFLTSRNLDGFCGTAAPTKLVFTAPPPASASSGVAFPGSIKVAIADASGDRVTAGISATVTLAIGTKPGSSTLACSGGNSETTTAGVATFTGCRITGGNGGYTLVASASSVSPAASLASATSSTITLAGTGSGVGITLTTSPAANAATPPTAVIVWGKGVNLLVHVGGAGGNRSIALQGSRDQKAWSTIATLKTSAAGDAAFTYRPSDNRYYRATFAGATDLPAATSNVVRVVVRSIILLRPTNSAVASIKAGTQITFTATARPNRPELPQARANFVVYRLQSGALVKVLDRTVDVNLSTGNAVLTIPFDETGSFSVRAQLVPTPVNANSGWTPLERYDVV